jgi:DNA excision repair protein ERCC-2
MKKITLSVQEFAQPAPRRGSLEPSSSMATSLAEGIVLHQKFQEQRKLDRPEYRPEVPIKACFSSSTFELVVSGRMDGFIPGSRPIIEEIKSSFNIFELAQSIKSKRFDHSYYIQLTSYAYFYWKEHNIKPRLNFILISSRRDEIYEFEMSWDVKEYEEWLHRRLLELAVEIEKAEKRRLRRKQLARSMSFPFDKMRTGQAELLEYVSEGIRSGKKLLVQAPTGVGKTMGVLYPALKDSLHRGQRVIYLTPKNSQQLIAEEAIERLQSKGCQTRSLTITAKSKICFKAEPLCHPDFCEFAKDYYDKLETHQLKAQLSKKKKLTTRVLKNLASKYEVCPFELQLEAIEDADTIICDYNYVFGHQTALGKLSSAGHAQTGLPNLVIDEAHNLPARTMGNFSPTLSTSMLSSLMLKLESLPEQFRLEYQSLLKECIETIFNLCPDSPGESLIPMDVVPFLGLYEDLKSFLSRYLESDVEIKSRDIVLSLLFYWGDFTEILSGISPEQPEFFLTAQNDGRNRTVKVVCCDASGLIKDRYPLFQNVVLFSATLKPFDYYIRLAGLSGLDFSTAEFNSPFEKKNRKLLIIPQISTKYSLRQQASPRVAETIERICALRKGNYLVFFPSFHFLEHVLSLFKAPEGFTVLKQSRQMSQEDVSKTLELLRSGSVPTLLFAVQGGVFSEGIDYSGPMAIGAFIVGPPLPHFDFEREKMRDYYHRSYQAGFEYAYVYPAMAKAVQAAGRVIRTETDTGIIVLMDERFMEKSFSQSLPRDWFEHGPQELISQSILKDVANFWRATENAGE